MWSHVKKFKNFEKNLKYSKFFKIFLFLLQPTIYFLNPILQVFMLVFAILSDFKFFLTIFSSIEKILKNLVLQSS
jgi:hypothetical protein